MDDWQKNSPAKSAMPSESQRCMLVKILEQQRDGIVIKDESFRYRFVNKSACDMLMSSRDELLEKDDFELFDPEEAQSIRLSDTAVMADGVSQVGRIRKVEKAGQLRYVRTNRSRVVNCSDKPHILLTLEDVTAQHKATEELNDLYSVISMGPAIVFRCDAASGCFEYISDNAKRLGIHLGAIIKRTLHVGDVLHAEDRRKIYRYYLQCVAAKRDAFHVDIRVPINAGALIWYSVQIQLLRDESGKVTHFQGIASDVSERREMERELAQQQQQLMQADKLVTLGTLVSGTAHEINNPNGIIMLNAPMLEEMWQPLLPLIEDVVKTRGLHSIGRFDVQLLLRSIPEMLGDITKSAERIRAIVKSLKNFSRKGSDDLSSTVQLADVIEASRLLIRDRTKQCGICLDVACSDAMPEVRGNFQQLEQVVMNLLVNAVQSLYGRKDGRITVRGLLDKKREKLVVSVADNGDGIPEKNLKSIMDPFFTTRREQGGTGLGLSISAGIVDRHGGALEVKSRVGYGTTIMMLLPLSGSDAERKADGSEKQ